MMAELHRDEAGSAPAHRRSNGVATIGIVLGVLAAVAIATWYRFGRSQLASPARASDHLARSRFSVPPDRAGWGRTG